ncbi:hypothetical protein K1T71_007640 [Dendrolimus kikuchii]|uniref:Uncharacterized protein n=1 Tax=Dendrolimus kikuchii TaxID=765133 RepID=A0ACC1CXN6_9NEOP|nr:hypothetical protein K1T71_007640 [Dendrolimus kikuchii]
MTRNDFIEMMKKKDTAEQSTDTNNLIEECNSQGQYSKSDRVVVISDESNSSNDTNTNVINNNGNMNNTQTISSNDKEPRNPNNTILQACIAESEKNKFALSTLCNLLASKGKDLEWHQIMCLINLINMIANSAFKTDEKKIKQLVFNLLDNLTEKNKNLNSKCTRTNKEAIQQNRTETNTNNTTVFSYETAAQIRPELANCSHQSNQVIPTITHHKGFTHSMRMPINRLYTLENGPVEAKKKNSQEYLHKISNDRYYKTAQAAAETVTSDMITQNVQRPNQIRAPADDGSGPQAVVTSIAAGRRQVVCQATKGRVTLAETAAARASSDRVLETPFSALAEYSERQSFLVKKTSSSFLGFFLPTSDGRVI